MCSLVCASMEFCELNPPCTVIPLAPTNAMSMLTFYQNRAGTNLSAARQRTIEQAKDELRKLYGRAPRNGKR